ncbi:hypothetical protein BU26DRAFT_478024 [Trematosphaeria pertusa]|uniref:Cytochrome P450 n=1 Tax=Trematosphaeria pertusa TaxID=390896 RepID=A0A6A6IT33_9PLEO|nr:uncharacterized protein BU26DRAFT_478024 [Trematosphaeria pertusa]KAF2253661.1 hypothetical protein BU26DRAFT_478024 [Trematosphaeria pertusa]
MGVLRGLFLGVYASNGGIRRLFLPLVYLLFSSPFVILLLRYYRLDSKVRAYVPLDFKAPDILPQVFISLVAVLLATRAISGSNWSSSKDGRKRRVQLLPYWIPGVRHWGSIVFGGEGWMKSVRETAMTSIVAFNAAGAKHNVILLAPLLDQLLERSDSLDEAEISKWAILRNAFRMPGSAKEQYFQLRPALSNAFKEKIFKGAQMEKIMSSSLSALSETLPDLITFNSSIVDQMPWERVADIELTDGTVEAECELFALINEFFCNAIISPITGAHFLESYQLLASDLSTFNQLFYALALGLPRFFPAPGLPGAMLAKNRLLQNFNRVFNEITNPPKKRVPDDDESMSGEETDADTPTPLTALNELFMKHDVPIAARASITLQLLHSIFAEVVPLAFWTLLHIHSISATTTKTGDPEETPIEQIKKETKIWVEAIQPPSLHPSFPAPPEISFAGVPRAVSATSFPYLRSCINEARRLHKASDTTIRVTKPLTLTETYNIRGPDAQEQWELDVGSYIDVGLSQTLINTSPAAFLSPSEYKPDRFVDAAPPSTVTSPSDPQEPYATALLIALVAGIVQLWDITAAPKKSIFEHIQEAQAAAAGEKHVTKQTGKKLGTWVVPKAVDGASVKVPKGDVRVRIRRREGLPERRTLKKGR